MAALLGLAGSASFLLANDEAEPNGEPPPARTEVEQFAHDYVRLTIERRRAEAELEALRREIERTQNAVGVDPGVSTLYGLIAQTDAASSPLWQGVIDNNYSAYLNAIDPIQEELERENREQRDRWLKVRTEYGTARTQAFEASVQGAVTGRLASILNVDNFWLWFWAILAFVVVVGAYVFDRRHRLRRMFWVRRNRLVPLVMLLCVLLLIPVVPTALLYFYGNATYDSLVEFSTGAGRSPRAEMREELEVLSQEFDPADFQEQQESLWTQLEELHAERSTAPGGLSNTSEQALDDWKQSRQQLIQLAAELEVKRVIAEGIKDDAALLAEAWKKVDENQGALAEAGRNKQLAGGVLGSVLIMIAAGLNATVVYSAARRRRKTRRKCPKCLAEGTLVPFTDDEDESAAQFGDQVRCNKVIRNEPYEDCDFTFNVAYQEYVKLGFPTLGVASSGKTFWLAMLYRELNQGNYPRNVHFGKLKSRGAEGFDGFLKRILQDRVQLSASQADYIPEPVLFKFKDNDRYGKSEIITSLFDYAGTVTVIQDNFHRRRALDAEGYLFFLDPTRPSEKQAEALTSFREDLQLLKKIPMGKQIDRPVAICVSKLDLMVNESYAAESDVISKFYTDLKEIDSSSPEMSLEAIKRRSELVTDLRDTIWPGWDIERQVSDLFGGRYMFFPMTPVGLNEPGVTDLQDRVIEPYHILEPLLWLLQMNGYTVID